MSTEASKTLVLVDGSSYLFRAYHGLPALSNAQGEPTGAIYGVLNMLRKLLKDYAPQHIAVVFDAKGKTFRNELYADYKANRPPMPDDLRVQIAPLHEIIEALGLPLIVQEGVEADDVIGTLAQQGAAAGMQVVISTGDKDMAQLVNPQVSLINTMNNEALDVDGVVNKFGVKPEQIVDYLALMGDKVDNIPGVPKVGAKTACKWLQEYESLQNIIDKAAEFKGKIGENLRDSVSFLPLSQDLATIRTELELPWQPENLTQAEARPEILRAAYQRWGFNRWLDELQGADAVELQTPPESEAEIKRNYHCILQQDEFESWLKRLAAAEQFALDTETTGLDYMQAELVGLSFAIEAGEAAYLPLQHRYVGAPQQLDMDTALAALKPILEDPSIGKIGQHLKYDAHILLRYGIDLQGIVHDTMLESYVLDSVATRHNMDDLARFYLQRETVHFEDIAGKGKKQLSFDQIELEAASDYAAEDADITLQLHQAIYPKLQQQPQQDKLYRELELPLARVLTRMEHTGVRLDSDLLGKQSLELEQKLAEIEQQAYEVAGAPFNLGSPKQIREIFFDKLGLPVLRKTPKGEPSTAEEVLEELAQQEFELPRLILDHRGLSKLKSTYTDKLPLEINPHTGRVHTSYHQAVASTGRLSSSNPNLQNIPIRSAEGRRIREAFIPAEGHTMLALDYSQIELRIMAHLSADAGLVQAFAEGRDIHRATAAEVFGLALDEVQSEQRRAAKAINFGLIYGMSAFGLARQLGIERGEAQQYVDLYFARYPGVKDYMDSTRQRAAEQGYVETVFGRRLYLPEINARNAQRRQYAERTAINAPMQGTAADIIKRAMLAVDGWISEQQAPVKMLMQVHDELVFEVENAALESVSAEIANLMNHAAELDVPLLVEAGQGANWNEAH